MYIFLGFLDFNLEKEISVSPMWVRLPHLPLIFWDDSTLRDIGNELGRYIDQALLKENVYAYVRICVEVDLEKRLETPCKSI